MSNLSQFANTLSKDWYVQGTNAVPLYLTTAARSGFEVLEPFGLAYTEFVFHYKQGWGEMWYLHADLRRLWKVIQAKIEAHPAFLHEFKRQHLALVARSDAARARVAATDPQALTDADLLELFQTLVQAQIDAVGLGHIAEPIGLESEHDLHKLLKQELPRGLTLAQAVSGLTTPTEPSFVAKEEQALRRIQVLPAGGRSAALTNHARQFGWIANTYRGRTELTVKDFEERLESLPTREHTVDGREWTWSPVVQQLAETIRFTTIWQDQRKATVLQTIDALSRVVDWVAERSGLEAEALGYLVPHEALGLQSLDEIRAMGTELTRRIDGMYDHQTASGSQVVSGADYQALVELTSTTTQHQEDELRGTTANAGTAIGSAKIINKPDEMAKMEQGDVLVSHMTRPELMPAIRKAGAIVTDEGGITSHAAIVSRELGIPCVVGTKMATKQFHDRDTLEVRANHGVVRKVVV